MLDKTDAQEEEEEVEKEAEEEEDQGLTTVQRRWFLMAKLQSTPCLIKRPDWRCNFIILAMILISV